MKWVRSAMVLRAAFWTLTLGKAEAPPSPGVEHRRLEAYVGHWTYEQTFEASPFGKAGNGLKTSDARMTLGGFFLEERGKGHGPEGEYEWLAVTAYDSDHGNYPQFTFDNRGFSSRPDHGELVVGVVSSTTWTWTWNEEAQGKRYHCRATDRFSSDGGRFQYQWSYSEDGTVWRPWIRGTATKHASTTSPVDRPPTAPRGTPP